MPRTPRPRRRRRRPARFRAASGTALVCVLLLCLSACTAGYTAREDTAHAPADALTVALTAAPSNLDFTTTSGAAIPQALMGNVYQTLVAVNDDGEIVPQLARAWHVDGSGTAYTFELQEGVTFSDGSEFTADTVKFSVDRVRSKAWTNGLKASMDVVKGVKVVDPHTVTITLKRPSQAWLYSMTTLVGAMFTPSGVQHLARKAIGTGPFTVTGWKSGQSLTLTRREDYWGEPAAAPQVTLRYYADPVTATNALRGSAVDAVIGMQSPDLLPSFRSDTDYRVIEGTTTGEVVMSMNNQAAPFDDPRVRRAVMYAVNRQDVMDSAYAGYGTLIGAAVPPTDPYYEDLTGAYPYDPAKARALLRSAGVEGQTVTFSVPNLPYATAAAEVVVSDLKKVGLTVRIKQQEFPAVWLDQVLTRHDYQMSVISHVEPRDLLTLLGPDYYLGVDDPRLSELAAEADAADRATYLSDMKALVRRAFVDDAVADTLFLLPNLTVTRADVEGLPVNSATTALDLARVHRADADDAADEDAADDDANADAAAAEGAA